MMKNKTLKIITTVLLAAIMVVMFAACKKNNNGGNKTEDTTESKPDTTATQSAPNMTTENPFEVSYPLTVTDGIGKEITIEKEPQKISSVSLGSDEILLSLVDRARIRSISQIAKDPGLSNISDSIGDIDLLGTNSEMMIAAQPDIVIGTDFTNPDFIRQIEDAGITVYTFVTPGSIDNVKKVITDLAYILNAVEEGKALIDWMDGKLNEIKSKLDTLKPDEVIEALSLDSFFYTYGTGTTFDSISKYAGVTNLAADNGMEFWVQLSKEQVVNLNPDMILLPSWSYEGFDAVKFAEEFKNDPSLAGVDAVKNDRVFTLPEAHMTSFSQNMVLGVEDLAKAAYPELFK